MKSTPNILFITTDQQQKKTLGCYGNEQIKTPNIDELANRGMTFDKAYCENPICIPSRNTMITGRKSAHHRALLHNSSLSSQEKTIGNVLGELNYTTHFIGKPHFKSQQTHGSEESIEDWRREQKQGWNGPYVGFETVEMVLGHSNPFVGHYGEWLKANHKDKIKYFSEAYLEKADVSCGQGTYKTMIPEEIHSSTYVGNQLVRFLESNAEADNPFYCFASFPDPHWPLMTPPEYYEMYQDTPIDIDYPDYRDDPNLENYPSPFRNYQKSGKFLQYDGGGHSVKDKNDIEKITRAYWGSISLIDKNIGKIMKTLRDTGLEDDTLVIFTTDHGEYMGAHGMMAKGGVCWEEFINVPFIVSYPGIIPPGSRTSGLFSFTDIVPTILDFIEEETQSLPWDGISQKKLFTGERESCREALTVHHPNHFIDRLPPDQHVLIRNDGWKLIYFAKESGGQLYNLNDDPGEKRNLYNLKEYQVIQKEMVLALLDQIIIEKDQAPVFQTYESDPTHGCHVMVDRIWEDEIKKVQKY